MPQTEAEFRAFWDEFRRTGRQPPLHTNLGLELVDLSPTSATLTMELTDDFRGGLEGTVHGGILATFADITSAVALWSTYDHNTHVPVTTDMHVRYYRQPHGGPLMGYATVVHRGRRLLGTECVVTDPDKRVLARSTATYMVVPLVEE